MRKATEGQLSCNYYKWFCMQYPHNAGLLHHSPNEGKRNARTGAYLKKMGMQSGWPDYTLMIPCGSYHGFFLEMKLPEERNKSLPEHQCRKLKQLQRMGYYCCVAYSDNEAIQLTKTYLNNPSILPRYYFNSPPFAKRTDKVRHVPDFEPI